MAMLVSFAIACAPTPPPTADFAIQPAQGTTLGDELRVIQAGFAADIQGVLNAVPSAADSHLAIQLTEIAASSGLGWEEVAGIYRSLLTDVHTARLEVEQIAQTRVAAAIATMADRADGLSGR